MSDIKSKLILIVNKIKFLETQYVDKKIIQEVINHYKYLMELINETQVKSLKRPQLEIYEKSLLMRCNNILTLISNIEIQFLTKSFNNFYMNS